MKKMIFLIGLTMGAANAVELGYLASAAAIAGDSAAASMCAVRFAHSLGLTPMQAAIGGAVVGGAGSLWYRAGRGNVPAKNPATQIKQSVIKGMTAAGISLLHTGLVDPKLAAASWLVLSAINDVATNTFVRK